MQSTGIAKWIGWGIVAIIVLSVLFGSFGTIGAGERGIKTRLNAVVGEIQPGLYFKTPFIEDVIPFNVQTQKVSQDATAASSDLQDVRTTIAVNYNIAPDKVNVLYQTVGVNYQDVIIDPAIQETVKAATAKYTAEQLVTTREKVRTEIVNALTSKLQALGIIVTQVSITNFSFSKSFNEAIEAKVTAEQNALAAQNKLKQVQFEAQQKVATAEADAKSIEIQAKAVNSQGGADYVALQALKAWDGKICTAYCFAGSAGSSFPIPYLNLNK